MDEHRAPSETPEGAPAEASTDRRTFLGAASGAAMAGGLLAGYGTFAAFAARSLYPTGDAPRSWMFVGDLAGFRPGHSLSYRAPNGERVVIARRGSSGEAGDFSALSSTCPHLGCQVHWEGQNNRFFCPCHNGVFDPEGRGIGGPPGDAGQSLPRFPLKVEGGLLYILVPVTAVADARPAAEGGHRPGHDPCLAPRDPGGRA